MANQRKNNNKMNMNMSRPSMLWLYGLIGAFIIGYYVFGDVNDTPVPSDWATVERMVEKGEVEKIQVVNRDQAQVFLKKEAVSSRNRSALKVGFYILYFIFYCYQMSHQGSWGYNSDILGVFS